VAKKKLSKDPFANREASRYKKPIPSREFILSTIARIGVPLKLSQLMSEFALRGEEKREAISRRIKAMLRDGQLDEYKKSYVWPTGKNSLVSGKVHIKGKSAFVIPDDGSSKIAVIRVAKQNVYQGARVKISTCAAPKFKYREGRIVEILGEKQVVTGIFKEGDGVNFVSPYNKYRQGQVIIPQGKECGAQDGDIVVIKLLSTKKSISSLAEVKEVIGNENNPGIEIETITRSYGIPSTWSDKLLSESAKIKPKVTAYAKRGREDLTKLPLVTIDGVDSKDFDDAVYCESLSRGSWRLVVAIADVSHYVKQGSALDTEARARGNSTYFPRKVIPMLPEELSNGICSLNPHEDRLCLVCDMQISKSAKVTTCEFYEAVMNSKARLTYDQVADFLSGNAKGLPAKYADLGDDINNLYKLYKCLVGERAKRGAIDFDFIEAKIIYTDSGKIKKIEPRQRNVAHKIIEECMLVANTCTAMFAKKYKLPILYRNHEAPASERLEDVKKFLADTGIKLNFIKKPKAKDYNSVLQSAKDKDNFHLIQTVLLRSLMQAVYSPDSKGHFGLAYQNYCHFTSPIRRYPDLHVHRAIKNFIHGITEEVSDSMKDKLIELGEHCSVTERRSDDATREHERWLKCQYLQQYVGHSFNAVISAVTRFGFFAEIENIYVDGLVHISSLDNFYDYDQIRHKLFCAKSGKSYCLGDKVMVQVASVDVEERKIDFVLTDSIH